MILKNKNRSKFKFSKIQEFEHFEPDLGIDKNGFSFFDDKGNIIKFNINNEIIWKTKFILKVKKTKTKNNFISVMKII